ncbi:MAG: hypothetical protein GX758_03180 [Tenericutes bacterium]|nr:hypothetical protein [Mycoplasmatota bacterium]
MKKMQEYISYLTPEYLYIPFNNIENLKIKKNKIVYHNMFLGTLNDETKIYSPASGKIIGLKEVNLLSGKTQSLVIENDFIDKKEKLNAVKNINKLKKADIIESLSNYGFNQKVNSKTIMVVNSFYDKKIDLKDMVINYEFYEEILEAIDEYMEIFNMKACYICIPRDDLYSIAAYEKYINAFPNICIVHSNRKFKDSSCAFYSIEQILSIHKAIHLDYLYDNTIITIYDSKPTIVKIKIYTSLYELLKALKIEFKSKIVYVNNKEVADINNFVIDSSVRSILIKDNKI